MKHGILWCVVLLSGAPLASAATPATQLKSDTIYELRADGSYTQEQLEVVRIDSPQAVRAAGQMPLGYSQSLQTLEILEAYTTTSDGKRVEVGAGGIQLQESRQSSGAPSFSDRKVKVIVFPQVEVGSTITVHWRRTQLKAQVPMQFSMWETTAHTIDVESATVTLRAPEKLRLNFDTRDVDGGEVDKPAAGMREWRWSFHPVTGRPGEPRQVAFRDVGPYVIASTDESYEQFARAYDAGAAPMAKPTPAIRELAEQITTGIKDRREQARALYEWVSKNIRYVSIVLEDGGFVPHAADAIYQARYGDCKDHVVLLQALLAAKKIRSSAALIQAGDSFFIPRLPAARVFNHAITWLPDFELFVDSTAGVLPFGVLAQMEYGKQALVIDAGNGKPALRTLPLPTATNDWIDWHVDYVVGDDGTVTGRNYGESGGLYQGVDRLLLNSIAPDQRGQLANRAMGARGTTTLEVGDPRDFTRPFTYGAHVEMPQYIKLPGPGANRVPLGAGRFGGTLEQFVQMMTEPSRTLPMICPAPGRRTETASIKLPAGMKVTQLPQGVNLTMKYGSFASKYELAGDTLVATSTLALEYPSAVCPPEDYAALRDLAAAIGKQAREQFFYN